MSMLKATTGPWLLFAVFAFAIWFAILVIVSLQIAILLRPMLAVRKPDAAPRKSASS